MEPLTRKVVPCLPPWTLTLQQIDDISMSMRSLEEHQSSSRQDVVTLLSALDVLRSSSAVVTDRVNRLESAIQLMAKETKDAAEIVEKKHDKQSQSQEQRVKTEIQSLQTQLTQQLNYFQTQQTQQLNGALHNQDTKHQQSFQALQSSLNALQSSSQTLGDRFDYLQQSLKEVKNTVLPRLETHLLSHQKEVNNLQYEYSKGQLERDSGLEGLKEMKRNFLELERKLRDLESDQKGREQQGVIQREVLREIPVDPDRESHSGALPPVSPARKKSGGMNLGSLLSSTSPPKSTRHPSTSRVESEPELEEKFGLLPPTFSVTSFASPLSLPRDDDERKEVDTSSRIGPTSPQQNV